MVNARAAFRVCKWRAAGAEQRDFALRLEEFRFGEQRPLIQFTNTPEEGEEEKEEESCVTFKINSDRGLAIIAGIMQFATTAEILTYTRNAMAAHS